MALAETFLILFGSKGAPEVKRETKSVGDETDKLAGKQKLLSAQQASLAKKVTGLVAGYFSLRTAISAVSSVIQSNASMQQLAMSTGQSVEKLHELNAALRLNGGSIDSIAQAATKYGTSVDGMLKRIASQMEGKSARTQNMIGEMYGLDMATIDSLRGGMKGLNESLATVRKRPAITKEDFERARKFKLSLQDIKDEIMAWVNRVARHLYPAWERFVDVFKNHKPVILGTLAAIGVAMGVIALKSILMAAPVLLMVAALVAVGAIIGLLIEDFLVWKAGGESAFGSFHEKIQGLLESLSALWEALKEFWSALQPILDAVMPVLANIAKFLGGVLLKMITHVLEKFTKLFKFIANGLNYFFGEDDTIKAMLEVNKKIEASGEITSRGGASTVNNATSNNNQRVSVGEVNITTQATDAKGISRAVGSELQNALGFLTYDFSTGRAG